MENMAKKIFLFVCFWYFSNKLKKQKESNYNFVFSSVIDFKIKKDYCISLSIAWLITAYLPILSYIFL